MDRKSGKPLKGFETRLFEIAADVAREHLAQGLRECDRIAGSLEAQVGSPEWEELMLWATHDAEEAALEDEAKRHAQWQEEETSK